jgi:hypothetical protein
LREAQPIENEVRMIDIGVAAAPTPTTAQRRATAGQRCGRDPVVGHAGAGF